MTVPDASRMFQVLLTVLPTLFRKAAAEQHSAAALPATMATPGGPVIPAAAGTAGDDTMGSRGAAKRTGDEADLEEKPGPAAQKAAVVAPPPPALPVDQLLGELGLQGAAAEGEGTVTM